jgi:hypothetical protein
MNEVVKGHYHHKHNLSPIRTLDGLNSTTKILYNALHIVTAQYTPIFLIRVYCIHSLISLELHKYFSEF